MNKKKKIYTKTDVFSRRIDNLSQNVAEIPPIDERASSDHTAVYFGINATQYRRFDFAPWYGAGFDEITREVQIQIMRLLNKEDSQIEIPTIVGYCRNGLEQFLNFLRLHKTSLDGNISLSMIDRAMIDSFCAHMASIGMSYGSQARAYKGLKSVLVVLGRRKRITIKHSGEDSTFPKNPYPNSNKIKKGAKPLTKRETREFSLALKKSLMPIWNDDVNLSAHLLACALIQVALHTGRNTTPLLEMSRNCLQPHPKKDRVFLVLWKRRGQKESRVVLRSDKTDEPEAHTPTINRNIERLILRVLELTEKFLPHAPEHLTNRIWINQTNAHNHKGFVTGITQQNLSRTFKKITKDYKLINDSGDPLEVNIPRLRTTFGNRVYEILDGDLVGTAAAMGNTLKVTDESYMKADENSKKNWHFLGETLVTELLTQTIGATYKQTPVGKCRDLHYGQYAPKDPGATCMSFINCIRCKHYVLSGEDLYKLYSFYFRVYKEREGMNPRRWQREYAHIPRLIDSYIVAEGMKRQIFTREEVDEAREHARRAPHPFWTTDILSNLDRIS